MYSKNEFNATFHCMPCCYTRSSHQIKHEPSLAPSTRRDIRGNHNQLLVSQSEVIFTPHHLDLNLNIKISTDAIVIATWLRC